MTISAKNRETLECLFTVEKSIQAEYNCALNGAFSRERMNKLLESEDSLLQSLDLTPELFKEVADSIKAEVGATIDDDLPLAKSTYMTEKTYPYLRLYARLRRTCIENGKGLIMRSLENLRDLEIGMFYRCLIKDSEANPKMRKDLVRYAFWSLIDSPRIERETVDNGLYPTEYLDDYFGFMFDLSTMCMVKSYINRVAIPLENNAVQNRKERFLILVKKVLGLIQNYSDLEKKGISSKKELTMCSDYFKSILAIQPPKEREAIYKKVNENKELGLYPAVLKWEVEQVLAPQVRSFEFIDYKKM